MVKVGDKITISQTKDGRYVGTKSGAPKVGDKISSNQYGWKSGMPRVGNVLLMNQDSLGRNLSRKSGEPIVYIYPWIDIFHPSGYPPQHDQTDPTKSAYGTFYQLTPGYQNQTSSHFQNFSYYTTDKTYFDDPTNDEMWYMTFPVACSSGVYKAYIIFHAEINWTLKKIYFKTELLYPTDCTSPAVPQVRIGVGNNVLWSGEVYGYFASRKFASAQTADLVDLSLEESILDSTEYHNFKIVLDVMGLHTYYDIAYADNQSNYAAVSSTTWSAPTAQPGSSYIICRDIVHATKNGTNPDFIHGGVTRIAYEIGQNENQNCHIFIEVKPLTETTMRIYIDVHPYLTSPTSLYYKGVKIADMSGTTDTNTYVDVTR